MHRDLRQVILIANLLGLALVSSCRDQPQRPQPEAVVTVLSATLEPTQTAETATVEAVAMATKIPEALSPSPDATADLTQPTAVTDTPPTTPTLLPGVVAYNLGDTLLVQERFPEDSRFRNMPARLDGIIAVPEGLNRPAPVVLILHGNHRGCPINPDNTDVDLWPCPADVEQQNYQGFDYLVRALADEGYVALAINVNAEYSIGFGEPSPGERMEQLIRSHLGALENGRNGRTK